MKRIQFCIAVAAGFATLTATHGSPSDMDGLASGLHDDGLLWLKVWNRAVVGDPEAGSGIYPAPDGPANIYYGTFALAAVKDGKYHVTGDLPHGRWGSEWNELPPTDRELLMSNRPNWSRRPKYITQEGTLDSYGIVDDAGAGENGPLPAVCEVHGISWSLEEYDDLLAFRYRVTNNHTGRLEEVYFIVAYDFEIGGRGSRLDDYVGFDSERLMPYMYDSDPDHPYFALVGVGAPLRGAYSWSPPEEWPYPYFTKPGFECARNTPNDWRIMLVAGPYAMEANEIKTVTFFVVAGADLEELQKNADMALEVFRTGPPPGSPTRPQAFNLARNHPNPVTISTTITFACPVSARVKLSVYDLAGRRVALLADDIYPPGTHDVTWAPEGVPPGVYIYALEAAGERFAKTMIVAR